MNSSPAPQAAPATSGLAITSLVLGILSFFGACLTALPALICGFVALSKIKKSKGLLGGKGMAIGGIVSALVLSLPGLVISAGLVVPTVMKALGKAQEVTAVSQALDLSTAINLYAAENNGDYPSSLDDLVPDHIDTKFALYELKTITLDSQQKGEMVFVTGLTPLSPGESILLYTPPFESGKRIVARVDGSAIPMDETDFRAQLKAQGSPLP